MTNQSFERIQNIFLLYKRHFTVDLRELRLTIRAQIFVAETTYNLIITVVTTHHQELFERLRRLWQSVKLSGIHAAWNHEIASSFRS